MLSSCDEVSWFCVLHDVLIMFIEIAVRWALILCIDVERFFHYVVRFFHDVAITWCDMDSILFFEIKENILSTTEKNNCSSICTCTREVILTTNKREQIKIWFNWPLNLCVEHVQTAQSKQKTIHRIFKQRKCSSQSSKMVFQQQSNQKSLWKVSLQTNSPFNQSSLLNWKSSWRSINESDQ